MLTLEQCLTMTGLASDEVILGMTPGARHRMLLESYLTNIWRGPKAVRDMIIGDMRDCIAFGAKLRAADLLIVLRQFLSAHPCARAHLPFERRNIGGASQGGESLSGQSTQEEPEKRAQVIPFHPRRLKSSSWRLRDTREACKPRIAS
ncbi:MAG TPA: hypothetical protein VMJ31_05210 [Methylocystis sp.]|nr:hypothetical protein [Methylocystis sp.]